MRSFKNTKLKWNNLKLTCHIIIPIIINKYVSNIFNVSAKKEIKMRYFENIKNKMKILKLTILK